MCFTCVFSLNVWWTGAADTEAGEWKSLVAVHIEKVARHRELHSIKEMSLQCKPGNNSKTHVSIVINLYKLQMHLFTVTLNSFI